MALLPAPTLPIPTPMVHCAQGFLLAQISTFLQVFQQCVYKLPLRICGTYSYSKYLQSYIEILQAVGGICKLLTTEGSKLEAEKGE